MTATGAGATGIATTGAAAMPRPDQRLYVRPQWQAPINVRAAFSLRTGGISQGAFESLNLATHVGDEPAAVIDNRRLLRVALDLPTEPVWLTQVHGVRVVNLDCDDVVPPADAAITRQRGYVCAVQVADCLPVLLATRRGDAVGVAHAGWRGLAAGVLEATVAAFGVPGETLVAWLGPAIGPAHFEVGAEVHTAFVSHHPASAAAFRRNDRGRWQCDLKALARARLGALGVRAIDASDECTYAARERYFSYRRDGQTGRMAALIWLD